MKKEITIYELAGLIKDNKAPKRIKFYSEEYYFDECGSYVRYDGNKIINFEKDYPIFPSLNYKVEIIEEPKELEEIEIENDNTSHFYIRDKHGTRCQMTKHSKIIAEKVNEIIRYIKSKENK